MLRKKENKKQGYSLTFRQKLVSEIKKGKLSIGKARKICGIGGKMTIQRWLKKYSEENLAEETLKKETVNTKKKKDRRDRRKTAGRQVYKEKEFIKQYIDKIDAIVALEDFELYKKFLLGIKGTITKNKRVTGAQVWAIDNVQAGTYPPKYHIRHGIIKKVSNVYFLPRNISPSVKEERNDRIKT